MERRLWILIGVLTLVILLILAKRRWAPTDPHASQEIEKAKER
jgi:hypothetical protein